MKTVFDKNIFKEEIEKSKFIGYLFHAEEIENIKTNLKIIQKEFPKATHYCYAYSINGKLKNSDDGEPSGTAGNPIQEAIIQNKLDNICIVVIRYFGGIKLGAGGLTRAYINTALKTIGSSNIVEITNTKSYKLTYDYNLNNIIQRFLNERQIHIVSTEYDIQVSTSIATNEDINELLDLTNGKIKIEPLDSIQLIKKQN